MRKFGEMVLHRIVLATDGFCELEITDASVGSLSHGISTIEEVLAVALPGSRQEERQDEETRERVLSNA